MVWLPTPAWLAPHPAPSCAHRVNENVTIENLLKGVELFIWLGLRHFGLEPERFRLEWVSASEGPRFAQVMRDMVEAVKEVGPSPYAM